MTTNQLSTIDDLFKCAFGYNNLFNELNRASTISSTNFPPYNIIADDPKDPTQYVLELAVAGFSKDDISVKIKKEDGVDQLEIQGSKQKQDSSDFFVVRMMATRSFKRVFSLAENARIDNIKLENGILRITIKIIKPERHNTETILQIE